MTTNRVAHGGMRFLGIYELGDNGLPFVSAASADPESGVWVNMANSFVPSFPEGTIIQFAGDDMPQGVLNLAPAEMSSITISTGVNNLEVDAILGATKVFTFAGNSAIGRETDRDACIPTVMLLAYSQGIDKNRDSATFGNTYYRYYLVMQAMVRAQAGGHENGNASTTEYQAHPRKVNQALGIEFSIATNGFLESGYIDGHFPGPPVLDAWLIDAVPTLVLNLSTTPLGDGLDPDDFLIVKVAAADGAVTDITAASTIDASAKTLTVAAALEDDVIYAFYASADGCPA